ncbi:M28 family peptidase [Aequorivita sp. H23M31]|uniref:M28 family peptidase n=1 Tax=Aequorivita ciconiae TaxID=2494375 RepID=A0A410G2K1_9FLAO|nr:M28 family metallopeptidase [Aequorivita sp. H23M31]QAA81486.1 M28 family peptidase [Aequorivita sp. H23M31]
MKKFIPFVLLLLLIACKEEKKEKTEAIQVSEATIANKIERLASDEFMGRMPFTEGDIKTTTYLEKQFKDLGLEPGNGDSYFQKVPMVEITGTPSEEMHIGSPKGDFDIDYYKDYVAVTLKTDSVVSLKNSELVFAGFGIVAPEYGWNDYEGIDWKGKTAVVLVNDPGFNSGDSTLFKGDEMTYYGRWTYKYEEAARQGAAGVIIIHETEPASYGWNVIQSGWRGAQLSLESDAPVADVQAWISNEAAQKLMDASPLAGKDYKLMASKKDFKPVPMGITASLSIKNEIKRDSSNNVVAIIPGTDLKDEYIIYSAHWDHLGIGKPVNGDSIYNGAVDNASGTASLLAIAEAFKKSGPTRRSILFMAVTGEEQGLLGSGYYAEHPIYPVEKTVANINMDALSSPGPMKDLTIIGYGQSEMDNYAKEIADGQGRYIIPDPNPGSGGFFRSDHFSFAKIGIPALYASGTTEGFDMSKEEVEKLREDYNQNKYHQPSDEYDPKTTILSGVRFDAQLLYEVGLKLANEDYFPKWNEGSEFKATRDKQMKQ